MATSHRQLLLSCVVALAACSSDATKDPVLTTAGDAGATDDVTVADVGGAVDASSTGSDVDVTPSPDIGADTLPDASNDLGEDTSPDGPPIEAPLEEWTWVDVPEALCGNGASTGIGVNLTERSDDLFVFFMGGGACWDVNSCFVLDAAANIESGYDGSRFENEAVLRAAPFDRDEPANPLRDMSFVFIPYCTGDVHAGDRVTNYMAAGQTRDVHHVGAANVDHFLRRLIPTFDDAPRVFVSGSSAGGYGAQLNFHRFAEGFANAEVHALSDSGPLVQPYGGRLGEWDRAWTLQTPPGCSTCNTSLPDWFDHLVTTYPDSRFGLLAYQGDQTIHTYYGYPIGNSFSQAMVAFLDMHVEPASNAEAFVLAGTQHVMFGGLTVIATPDGTELDDWVSSWIDDADWSTARP